MHETQPVFSTSASMPHTGQTPDHRTEHEGGSFAHHLDTLRKSPNSDPVTKDGGSAPFVPPDENRDLSTDNLSNRDRVGSQAVAKEIHAVTERQSSRSKSIRPTLDEKDAETNLIANKTFANDLADEGVDAPKQAIAQTDEDHASEKLADATQSVTSGDITDSIRIDHSTTKPVSLDWAHLGDSIGDSAVSEPRIKASRQTDSALHSLETTALKHYGTAGYSREIGIDEWSSQAFQSTHGQPMQGSQKLKLVTEENAFPATTNLWTTSDTNRPTDKDGTVVPSGTASDALEQGTRYQTSLGDLDVQPMNVTTAPTLLSATHGMSRHPFSSEGTTIPTLVAGHPPRTSAESDPSGDQTHPATAAPIPSDQMTSLAIEPSGGPRTGLATKRADARTQIVSLIPGMATKSSPDLSGSDASQQVDRIDGQDNGERVNTPRSRDEAALSKATSGVASLSSSAMLTSEIGTIAEVSRHGTREAYVTSGSQVTLQFLRTSPSTPWPANTIGPETHQESVASSGYQPSNPVHPDEQVDLSSERPVRIRQRGSLVGTKNQSDVAATGTWSNPNLGASSGMGAELPRPDFTMTLEVGAAESDSDWSRDDLTLLHTKSSEHSSSPIARQAVRTVVETISERVQVTGRDGFDVRLSPEELGRLRISFASTESGLNVTINADRPETLDLFRRNIELLSEDLRALGYEGVSMFFGEQERRDPEQSDVHRTQERSSVRTISEIVPGESGSEDTGTASGVGVDLRL